MHKKQTYKRSRQFVVLLRARLEIKRGHEFNDTHLTATPAFAQECGIWDTTQRD